MKKQAKTKKYPKFIYEKEDDILNIWFSSDKIDDAYQQGDVIIHVAEDKEPVYIEILDASKFLQAQTKALPKDVKESVFA